MKSLLLTALGLTLSLSCHKDPPDPGPSSNPYPVVCNDGTCCGRDKITYEYVEYLTNEPADLEGGAIVLKVGVPHGSPYVATVLSICDLTADKVRGLPTTYTYPNTPYKYRLWGKVYGLKGIIGTDPIPILSFYIDSIKVAP